MGNAGAEEDQELSSCTQGAESGRGGSGPSREASAGGKGERVVACGPRAKGAWRSGPPGWRTSAD